MKQQANNHLEKLVKIKTFLAVVCILSLCHFAGFAESSHDAANFGTAPIAQKRGRSASKTRTKRTAGKTRSRSGGRALNSSGGSSGNLIRGPRGGCYYINRSGNKTYVSRSVCN